MKYLVTTLLMLMCSCQHKSNYSSIVNKISNSYSSELYKSQDFDLIGTGGATAGDIKELFLDYWSHRLVDLCEARILYVNTVEGFIKLVNENKEIRPYLHDFPFTIKNTEISLGFVDEKNCHVKNKKIAFVFEVHGNIHYCISSKDTLVTVHVEPYEKALRIVNEQNCTLN